MTPKSWTGWFTANTLSVNLKDGLGISFGGSLFAGADSGWSPGTNLNFVDIEEKKRWFGVSVDIGIGAGTPSIHIGVNYASYYWLMDENRAYSYKKDGIDFGRRWFKFLKGMPDAVIIFEKLTGFKFPKWLETILDYIVYFIPMENIDTDDKYSLVKNKQDLEKRYQTGLAKRGYDSTFFAELESGQISSNYDLV